MHNKLAHTAEHAFIGSLQKNLGITLNVRKVEHRKNDSSVIIKLEQLDLETVIKAQREVNLLIQCGRKVKSHSYETLEEAKTRFPHIRVNEERIKQYGPPIRVIEIEGHDIAACAMDHASNLCECEFFLVTKVSSRERDSEYEIDFTVKDQAKEASTILVWKLLGICKEVGANINTVENTVKRLSEERRANAIKLKRITAEYLSNIVPEIIDKNNIKVNLFQETFYGLDDEEIRSFAGKKIADPDEKSIVLLAHIPIDNEENASIVFARTDALHSIDCNRLFREHYSLGGRGGGKATYVTGVIKKEKVGELVKHIITDVTNLL
ncbi:MAG TPA: hypothetical protein VFS97_12750 [Nitrososphaeraceae archaeon]|nr:hypothetical protein [Nitrososphaeraceae archaeon]